jgi:hypothetical protein
MSEQQTRIIVWQAKGIAAIYSHVFKTAKQRLKYMLKDHIIYVDGLSPIELNTRISHLSFRPGGFLSNDLKKQDRQTTHGLIDCEFRIYAMLGVSESVLTSWRAVHNSWVARGKRLTTFGDAMRLTGQATTALGNAIVDMLCNTDLVLSLNNSLHAMVILGDDNAMYVSDWVDKQSVERRIRTKYNMNSRLYYSRISTDFCGLMMYENNSGQLEFGPNIIRLKRRFEVTNGVSEATSENLALRSMSYAMSLGAHPSILELIIAKNWPIKVENWYDHGACVHATAAFNETSAEEVLLNQSALIEMFKNPTVHTTVWTVAFEK